MSRRTTRFDLLCAVAVLAGCADPPSPAPAATPPQASAKPAAVPQTLRVGVAASLRAVLDDVARDFEARHPGTTVNVVSEGSSALCRKALDLGEPFDVLVLADAELFSELLEPQWTEAHVLLASDRLVLARSKQAPGADRVGPSTVGEVLLADGVRLGMADPARAPLGYRTLIAFQLLEQHGGKAGLAQALRARVGERFVWPDAAQLLAHLQTGELDYAVLYAASAHDAGLAFSELPPEVNLGDLAHAPSYATESVTVVGLTPGSTLVRRGAPVVYAAALAKRSESDQATRLMADVLGARGAKALGAHGFTALVDHPARVVGELPTQLASALGAQKAEETR